MNLRNLTYGVTGLIALLGALLLSSFTKVPSTKTHNCALDAPAWGFFGHKRINELSVYTLPSEMFGFYKANIEYIIDHSVDPDKRRYGVIGEAECHYIDMDRYITPEYPNPFDNVPRRWTDAVAKFSEDTLRQHGIVPWHVYNMTQRLTNAFKAQDKQRILRISAELGHYIGDAHVPLHTTSNYNGQLTGQRGIHGFWESRLVELYSKDYDFFVGKAQYINSPLNYIWDRVEESFACVDSVLNFEKTLTQTFGEEKKYSFESRRQANMRVYAEEYSKAYSDVLDGQVERRMKSAVYSIGSFWYTAWVDAGQPDLSKLFAAPVIEESDSTTTPQTPLKVREHE